MKQQHCQHRAPPEHCQGSAPRCDQRQRLIEKWIVVHHKAEVQIIDLIGTRQTENVDGMYLHLVACAIVTQRHDRM